jgi:hypothetical protein
MSSIAVCKSFDAESVTSNPIEITRMPVYCLNFPTLTASARIGSKNIEISIRFAIYLKAT